MSGQEKGAVEAALEERTNLIMDIVQKRIAHWLWRKQAEPLWNDIKKDVRTALAKAGA